MVPNSKGGLQGDSSTAQGYLLLQHAPRLGELQPPLAQPCSEAQEGCLARLRHIGASTQPGPESLGQPQGDRPPARPSGDARAAVRSTPASSWGAFLQQGSTPRAHPCKSPTPVPGEGTCKGGEGLRLHQCLYTPSSPPLLFRLGQRQKYLYSIIYIFHYEIAIFHSLPSTSRILN